MAEIHGLKDLIDFFKEASECEDRLKDAMEEVTLKIETDAKDNCPVGEYGTGELKESIKHYVTSDKKEVVGTVFTDCDHAAFVEFGTGPRHAEWGEHPMAGELGVTWTDEPWDWGHVKDFEGYPARPYMYPALLSNQDKAVEKLGDAVFDFDAKKPRWK